MTVRSRLLGLIALAVLGVLIVAIMSSFILKQQMLEDRQEKLRNLVELSIQLAEQGHAKEQAGKMNRSEAQAEVIASIKALRYSGKEYFWINDMQPRMVMHAIKPELDGKDLSASKDPDGKLLFVSMVDVVKQQGKGFVDYQWPKPGADQPQAKLSFVQGFAPWGWVIGTGVYIEDISQQFWQTLLTEFLIIVLCTAVLIAIALAISRSLQRQLGGEPSEAAAQMQAIAAGDLQKQIPLKAGDQQSMMFHLCTMQTALRQVVSELGDVANGVNSMSTQLATDAHQVENGSSRQQEAAEAMAAAITEMTESIHHIASSADSANEHSRHSEQQSRSGSAVLSKAVHEMDDINQAVAQTSTVISQLVQKTESISTIMNTIRDVADQTNLLALNAAIEAARAGEQGRGFAVVADEVRKLAERTSRATTEIAGMIDDIQQGSNASRDHMQTAVERVSQGVSLARQGGEVVLEIEQSARKTLQMVESISSALHEQTQANQMVNEQVDRIAMTSESNAAAASNARQLSTQLQAQTHRLREVMTRFRT